MDKKKLILTAIWLPIVIIGIINIFTIFTPEIGFDALWYHLTLPKLWLTNHQWFFKGGLLYYSVMPRLSETIFIPLIKLTGYVGPKFVQYLSGIGVCFLIWKITSKLKLSLVLRSIAVSIFYCTWLVSWQSGSAYIDLFRTFLETTALYFLISGSWKKGGIFLGLAVGTKLLALGSVAILALVFGFPLILPALLLSLPWFIVAFKFTGNPVYPMFDSILHNSFSPIFPIVGRLLILPIALTFPFDDFISPLIFLLVILSSFSLFDKNKLIRKIALVGILGAAFSISLEPPSSRYFLPYFPAIVISAVALVGHFKARLQTVFVFICILSSVFILSLRVYADKKYLPFILGKQTQNEFLTEYSDRLPDTFIDSDSFVEKNIPKNSRILIDKLHNLYYFPFGFDHTSWISSPTGYDYFITIGTRPEEIKGELIHTNSLGIQVYKLNK